MLRRLLPRTACSPGSGQAVGQGGILTAPLPAVRAEELHSIKGELSQIKAQVDSLLESLDRMDQRRERLAGEGTGRRPSGTRMSVPGSLRAHASLDPEPGVRGPSLHSREGARHPEPAGQIPLVLPEAGRAESGPLARGDPARTGLLFARVPQISAASVLAGSKESEKKRVETGAESPSPAGEGSREPRGKEGTGADGHSDLRNIDSAEESTDTEETVRGGPDPVPASLLP